MRKLLGILGLLALSLGAAAQSAIEITAPNLVAADEQFNVTFKIDGEKAPTDFEWSPGDDFKLVWGPQKGSSTSFSMVNGKTTRQSTTTYTYVLMPRSTGTFTLAAATATVKGKKVSSGTRSIQVVSGGQQGSQAGGQASSGAARSSEVSGDDIFLRLTLSKNSAVVGEGITATLKLYTRVQVAGFEDARFPGFDGFWSQQLQAPQNIQFQRENVGGQIYDAALLRSWTLIPQRAGDIAIDPAELVCLVNVRNTSSRSGSIFDSFFQDEYRTIRKRVSTPARTIKVNALPAGAPASFGGGVGKFSMKASLSRDSLKTHDAASLLVTVSGSGNIALLEAPKVVFPPDFEVYDVKSTEKGGVKSFEYPFIPRSHGSFVIGPVEYSYYDIAQGRYVTLRSQEMPLEVTRSSNAETPAAQGGSLQLPEKKDVKDLGSDIRFIATRVPAFASPGAFLVWSPLFWGLTGALLLLAAALYFGLRKRADIFPLVGVGSLLFGLLLMICYDVLTPYIKYVLAAFLLLASVAELVSVMRYKKLVPVSAFFFVVPLLIAVAAIFIFVYRGENQPLVMTVLGMACLVYGLEGILSAIIFRKARRQLIQHEQPADEVQAEEVPSEPVETSEEETEEQAEEMSAVEEKVPEELAEDTAPEEQPAESSNVSIDFTQTSYDDDTSEE